MHWLNKERLEMPCKANKIHKPIKWQRLKMPCSNSTLKINSKIHNSTLKISKRPIWQMPPIVNKFQTIMWALAMHAHNIMQDFLSKFSKTIWPKPRAWLGLLPISAISTIIRDSKMPVSGQALSIPPLLLFQNREPVEPEDLCHKIRPKLVSTRSIKPVDMRMVELLTTTIPCAWLMAVIAWPEGVRSREKLISREIRK